MPSLKQVTFSRGLIRAPYRVIQADPLPKVVPIAQERADKTHGKHWSIPLADSPAVVAWADRNNIPVDLDVRDYSASLWSAEVDAVIMSTASSIPDAKRLAVEGLRSDLLGVQEVVVSMTANSWITTPDGKRKGRGVIVADEPGLGKTLSALASLRTEGLHSERSLIICPTGLTQNWQAEMLRHFDFGVFQVFTATTETPSPVPEECDTVVIGWEILSAWVDALIKWRPTAVIADEGHYAKSGKQRTRKETVVVRGADKAPVRDEHGNLILQEVQTTVKGKGSARATAALQIGSAVARSKGLVMALTGTPIVSRPAELEPLLEFVGILDVFGGATAYKERFCGPTVHEFGGERRTDYSGASNLLELNSRLAASGHYIRRTNQILVDQGVLPRKYVDGVYCYDHASTPSPWVICATPSEMAEYEAAEADIASYFERRAREIAREFRVGLDSELVRSKLMKEGAVHLQRITALRQIAAKVKVKYVVEQTRKLVSEGERVVIASHHRQMVDLYAEVFGGLKITGGMGVGDVERAKAKFNTSSLKEAPVLSLSVEAGKTGHTLCKQFISGVGPSCRTMIIAEQGWTPGDELQVQNRIWRIGQERETNITNALLKGTVDGYVYAIRQRKREVLDAAMDAVDRGRIREDREGAGELAWMLARQRMQ